MKIKEQAKNNVKTRLSKALESYTIDEIAKAYKSSLQNFNLILKKLDNGGKVNLSTLVRINRALDKLEGK